MNLTGFPLVAFLAIGLIFSGKVGAMETATKPPPAPHFVQNNPEQSGRIPSIEKMGSGIYRLGEILVDKNARSIVFPAQVNMDSGLLEYLIVHRKGKTHESLLRTSIDPYNLQIAFLLLGFEGAEQRLAMQGDPSIPQGEPVQIRISTTAGKGVGGIPAEQWLINKIDDKVKDVVPMKWVFSGSYIDDGRFMSQETGSIVAIWHDPVALIDNASPGGESNRIWYVRQGVVPPVGTPVEVSIKSTK